MRIADHQLAATAFSQQRVIAHLSQHLAHHRAVWLVSGEFPSALANRGGTHRCDGAVFGYVGAVSEQIVGEFGPDFGDGLVVDRASFANLPVRPSGPLRIAKHGGDCAALVGSRAAQAVGFIGANAVEDGLAPSAMPDICAYNFKAEF